MKGLVTDTQRIILKLESKPKGKCSVVVPAPQKPVYKRSKKMMANPQPDEYTKISNELLEHLISTPLSGNQWQVLMCIIRKTYGYHKKHDYLTNNQIIEATGLGKTVVPRCLTLLQKGNFITRNGHITGLQKDWELWQPELAKQLTKVSYPLDT